MLSLRVLNHREPWSALQEKKIFAVGRFAGTTVKAWIMIRPLSTSVELGIYTFLKLVGFSGLFKINERDCRVWRVPVRVIAMRLALKRIG